MSNPPAKSMFPPQVEAVLARVKGWFGSLSRPARVLLFSTTTLAALFITYLGYKQTHEPYGVLFTQLDQDDTSAMVAKLKELKIAYRLGTDGTTIEVPETRVAETRLELAGAGLPRGGGVGFESFDKMRLGATEFEQHVLYRRALEGELARTIGTLGSVQSVRIHLVMPEKSVFISRAEPASASIVLRLRQGRTLGGSEVAGIVHLTAASVPGLTPDRVAVVTTDGEMLKKPRAAAAADGSSMEMGEEQGMAQRAVEVQLEDRAKAMLEKVVGVGHVDVRVTADLDPARVERVEDHYDPTKSTLRSEEVSVDRSGGVLDDSVAGVPGAESNLPTGGALGAAAAALAAAAGTTKGDAGAPKLAAAVAGKPSGEQAIRESHTRNFEMDHISERRTVGPGALKRITVAVVLDGVSRFENGKPVILPRERAELEKLSLLVRSAVGASDARGDMVTVDSVPFDETKVAVDVAPVPAPVLIKTWRDYLPVGVGAAILLVLVIGSTVVGRSRSSKRRQAAAAAFLPPVVVPQQLGLPKPNLDVRAAAIERAAADPATAALVLRAWLGTLDGDNKATATKS